MISAAIVTSRMVEPQFSLMYQITVNDNGWNSAPHEEVRDIETPRLQGAPKFCRGLKFARRNCLAYFTMATQLRTLIFANLCTFTHLSWIRRLCVFMEPSSAERIGGLRSGWMASESGPLFPKKSMVCW
jgi:hypothetical protein